MRGRRAAIAGTLALALTVAVGVTGGAVAKKSKSKTFSGSQAPNIAIPDDLNAAPSIPVTSTITVPKKFQKKVVGDLNVTGLQTTGNMNGAAGDLIFKLTAPNGRTSTLIDTIGFTSIGPLTIDDDSPVSVCNSSSPPCDDPSQSLNDPFAGTANSKGLGQRGTGPLNVFNGVKMRGTWTITGWDEASIGQLSVFNGWGLTIKAAKPVKAEK